MATTFAQYFSHLSGRLMVNARSITNTNVSSHLIDWNVWLQNAMNRHVPSPSIQSPSSATTVLIDSTGIANATFDRRICKAIANPLCFRSDLWHRMKMIRKTFKLIPTMNTARYDIA